jgi:hypothetical protein
MSNPAAGLTPADMDEFNAQILGPLMQQASNEHMKV